MKFHQIFAIFAYAAILPAAHGLEFEFVRSEFLPARASNVTSLKLDGCSIRRLQQTARPLWPNLKDIRFRNVRMLESPWPQLKGAAKLESLSVRGNSMADTQVIGRSFRDGVPSQLKILTLEKTGTSKLERGSIAHLSNLFLIKFVNLPLVEFPRSALPASMPNLRIFMLDGTYIRRLEKSFFDKMPMLGHVFLSNNQLKTLPMNLFSPSKHSQLSALILTDNPFECGCDLLWLQKNYKDEISTEISGTCKDKLSDHELMSLEEDNYC